MSRDKPISIYVEEEEARHLKREAEEEGETLSSYLYKLIQKQRQEDGMEQAAVDMSAEERIESLVADATTVLEETAEDLREMQARSGVYSIAAYELLQNDVLQYGWTDSRAVNARKAGADRLQIPFEDHAATDRPDTSGGETEEDADENSGEDASGSKSVDDLL